MTVAQGVRRRASCSTSPARATSRRAITRATAPPSSPPRRCIETLRAAVLASDARSSASETTGSGSVRGDPTEGALIVAAAKAGLHQAPTSTAVPARERDPVHLREQAHDHAARDAGRRRRVREGRARGRSSTSCTRQLTAAGERRARRHESARRCSRPRSRWPARRCACSRSPGERTRRSRTPSAS